MVSPDSSAGDDAGGHASPPTVVSSPGWARSLGNLPSAAPDSKTPALDAAAAQAGLGSVVRRLRFATEARLRYLLAAGLLLGAAIAIPVLLTIEPTERAARHHKGKRHAGTVPLMRDPKMLVVPFAAPIGLYALVRLLLVLGVRLQVHAQGFVFARGGKTQVVRWDQVKTIHSWIYEITGGRSQGTYGTIKIDLANGSRVTLTEDVDDICGVRDIVQQATFEHLMASIEATIDHGSAVPFGPLALSREGLTKGGDLKRWSEIESTTLWEGKFSVKLPGKFLDWASVKTKHIPNVHVFLAAVDHYKNAAS